MTASLFSLKMDSDGNGVIYFGDLPLARFPENHAKLFLKQLQLEEEKRATQGTSEPTPVQLPMLDWAKPFQTRSGWAARAVTNRQCKDGKSVVVMVMVEPGIEHAYYYRTDGTFQDKTAAKAAGLSVTTQMDLVNQEAT